MHTLFISPGSPTKTSSKLQCLKTEAAAEPGNFKIDILDSDDYISLLPRWGAGLARLGICNSLGTALPGDSTFIRPSGIPTSHAQCFFNHPFVLQFVPDPKLFSSQPYWFAEQAWDKLVVEWVAEC